MTYHAHYESAAQDCDGLYTRDYILAPSGDEDEWQFENHVLTMVVDTAPKYGGTLTVSPRFDDGTHRLEWHEQTDEGYRHREATFCRDDCDFAESSFRDHTAEAAGY